MAMNSTRRKATGDAEAPMSAAESQSDVGQFLPAIRLPHLVYPNAVYTVEDLRRLFGLKASSVRREVRLRRLRFARRCGRNFFLGEWVLQWLKEGEVKAQTTSGEANADLLTRDQK